jgi:hypothetical protein
MFSLVDLILLRDNSLDRTEVEKILTLATEIIKERLLEGSSVLWVGLCTFTYKKKATTKKAAKEWQEFPYLAEGDKVRIVADSSIDGLTAKGGVAKLKKEKKDDTETKAA